MSKYLLITIGVLVIILSLSLNKISSLKQERTRLESNQAVLNEKFTIYKTKDSLNAIQTEKLAYTVSEFKRFQGEMAAKLEKMDIKLSRVQSIAQTGTESRYEVHTTLRDSIILRDSMIPEKLPCLNYVSPYIEFKGCFRGDDFMGEILTRDTLDQVVHRIPHKFWFIKWGTKAIRQDIISRNPHTKLVYSSYIEVGN